VDKVHAVVLAGGSAFGLDAASGVMKYLAEQKIGYGVGPFRVPIVPAAILFDLGLGKSGRHPDPEMGYQAACAANDGPVSEGNAGAGSGATVGKIFGLGGAMKSGLGSASIEIGGGVIVGAIVAVNAFGDVLDPVTGQIIAGARPTKLGPLHVGGAGPFANTMEVMKSSTGRTILNLAAGGNTGIAVIATNAKFNKAQTTKLAQMAQDGLARTIRPAHTMFDGDTVFALATGQKKADVSTVGAYAAEALAQAIVRAVNAAKAVAGLPAAKEM
jgi:L-aminopeptidase/D-esterase-like protein